MQRTFALTLSNSLKLRTRILTFHCGEWLKSLHSYFRHPRVLLFDFLFWLYYAGLPPDILYRKFYARQGEEDYDPYGETPLSILLKLKQHLKISSHSRFIDLGCGSGRVAMRMQLLAGCQTSGCDLHPLFIRRAKKLSRLLRIPSSFLCQDMREIPLSSFSAIYLYGTALSTKVLVSLAKSMEQLPEGARIACISESLTPYDETGCFPLVTSFTVQFPWGVAQVFIHEKRQQAHVSVQS